ncbi:polyisoprenoid diphosphate/phosphate phosphohydrolase PLPP6 isoform 2 [Danio rerio]|uniref:Polyisoprenoid diphosphate/phosphate phosphohydrolase PLPP6 n=1 Tax=Danio rerio TaxID=7955 RepID=A0A2U3TVI8_DANRE|nr:polyisoprenoid diphosphate/phosphate phosphohydrolase PLPP6 isoform 2 [Danio rerio]|eukprot:NP_001315268.1 phospholipid phosphatase 6 isoform 2 [Danio rerio]
MRLRGLVLGQRAAAHEAHRGVRSRHSVAGRSCLLPVQERQSRRTGGHAQPAHGHPDLFLLDLSFPQALSVPGLPAALVLDVVLVGVLKAVVRRRRPAHNRMDMFATFSMDSYSFPSGHATRAAMCARFLLTHLVLAAPLRVLVLLWATIVGFSRVLLGRHNVTDVAFGFFMGYWQYNLVEMLWLSPVMLQSAIGQLH